MRNPPVICCALAATVVLGCGGGASVEPGVPPTYGFLPDLRGTSVMVFPVQLADSPEARASMDREVEFAVSEAGLDWLLPEALERAGRRSPGLDIQTTDLPVGVFLRQEVKRIGEPLFGYLIRLGGLTGGPVALIPVASTEAPATDTGQVEWTVAAALIDVRSGRVIWYGSVVGEPGPPGSPRVAASAAQALIRRLARLPEA